MARIVYLIKQCWLDLLAVFDLLQERFVKRTNDKIRVGFVCQYIPAWNKSLPVYEKLKADSRFEVFLLCVPNRIEDGILQSPEDMSNDTYAYFTEHGYEAVNTLIGPNQWLDLKAMELDYVFFTRPYNAFMPEEYSSKRISRYSKICVLLYAMLLTKDAANTSLNRDFFRHVYCYFAETECSMRINKKHYPVSHLLGIRKSICYGMPALQQLLEQKDAKTDVWNFSNNDFRVMWTPRWTTDLSHGGTNFFVYKDSLLEFADKNQDMDFLFRPHPLAFDNFIKTGEMTADEVAVYKQRIADADNVCLDVEKEYVATMWNSSVLISDLSGVMPEYFITGKPIIYCGTNMILQPTEHFQSITEGCYNVKNKEELFQVLAELRKGNDSLYEKRQQIMKDVFGADLSRASEMIVEELQNG